MNDASPPKPTLKVSRQGKEIGEYDAESIQAMLDGGILNGTEFCWQSGFKNWVPIASLFNVPTDIDQQDGEASKEAPTDEPEVHASAAPRGKLLSPTAIANLSLLFGPFWGPTWCRVTGKPSGIMGRRDDRCSGSRLAYRSPWPSGLRPEFP